MDGGEDDDELAEQTICNEGTYVRVYAQLRSFQVALSTPL